MLSKLEIILENTDNKRLSYNISSLFQGVIMENISPSYAEILHGNGLKPYSHHVEFEKDTIRWTINTLTKEAKEEIINPISNNIEEITLRQKNLQLKVIEKKLKSKTYDQLLDEKYFSEGSKYIDLEFIILQVADSEKVRIQD